MHLVFVFLVMQLDDAYFMKQAMVEAEKAFSADEVPVGALIADRKGQIFAKTGAWRAFWNDTIFLNCKSGYSGVSAEKIAENRCCPNATKCSQINTELNQTARAVFMDDQEEREWQTQWRNKQCLCTTDECYSGPMCMVCGGLRGDAYVLDPLSKKCKACTSQHLGSQ